MLREELQLLQEPGSYVGEVVKVMGKNKVLVKVQCFLSLGSMLVDILFYYCAIWCHLPSMFNDLEIFFIRISAFIQVHPEGKYVVDIDKSIDITKITPSTRVALRNDSYVLHLILPSKVDPLVNLMKVEKVPDSTYDMIGGLDQQIKEIKEVCIFFCFWFCPRILLIHDYVCNVRLLIFSLFPVTCLDSLVGH